MARNCTVIHLAQVVSIASKLGLNVKTGKNETKIFGESIKQSIAIPNTKGGATRIYPVGFEPLEGTVAHPKPPAKTVTVMFDHSMDEKLILRAIYKAAMSMKMKAAPAPVPEVTSSPEVVVEQVAELEQVAS